MPSCSYTSSAMLTWVATWTTTTARPALSDTTQEISYAGARLTRAASRPVNHALKAEVIADDRLLERARKNGAGRGALCERLL
jgi:hypothetical protein